MKKNKFSINLSLTVLGVVSLALALLLVFGPKLFEMYMISYRGFDINGEVFSMLKKVFGICFYSSSVFSAIILFALFKLLFNIKKGEVFIMQNAACLRVVAWCCFIISAITFVGGFFHIPLLSVSCAGVFTGVLLRVLKNVMYSGVQIKQDNDLTI